MTNPKKYIYFGSSEYDKAEQRRVRAISALFDLKVIYLRGPSEAERREGITVLLKQKGGARIRLLSRFRGQLKAIAVLKKLLSERSDTILIVKNLDNLLTACLAQFSFRKRKHMCFIYEVCDIHPLYWSRMGRLLRALERYIVRKVIDRVMTTSMGFQQLWEFQTDKIFLWENYYAGIEDVSLHQALVSANPVCPSKIVYHGRLRDQRSMQILAELKTFEVALHGQLEGLSTGDIRQISGFEYPEDIYKILGTRCLVWCVTGDSLNESLLLSNRLYDAIAFQCIPIISTGSYQETYCRENGAPFIAIDPQSTPSAIEQSIISQLSEINWDYDTSRWLVNRTYVPEVLKCP
jgi:hypothetical protein